MAGRKDHSFGDVEFYQARKQIKKRFNKILTDLQKTVERNGYAVQTVQRFRGCLNNSENIDFTRLPFYSKTYTSIKYDKISCVLCLISLTIQLYWRFCNENTECLHAWIDRHLGELESIAAKGLKAFKIGNHLKSKRYYLEEK